MNYQSWLAKWLETYVRPVVKGKTLETYRGVVKDHLVPALGELELAELTPARLQAFVAQQAKSGNRRTGEGLSCASVNLIITVLQNSLKCAREADMVGGYAAEKLRRPRAPARETACFDLSEQAALVRAAMQAKDEKFRGIVLCLYTGLRLGELLALEWGDVDWERGLLYVSRTCREGRDEAGRFGRIVGAPKSRRSVRVIPLSGLPLSGRHNEADVLAAVCACKLMGAENEVIAQALQCFKGIPHRLQDIGEVEGVRFLDDSKATNVDAAVRAVESGKGESVVILGGKDKGEHYERLFAALKTSGVVHAVLCGENAFLLLDAAAREKFDRITLCRPFDLAVRVAFLLARRGQNVLLSPAAASYDAFKSYEERGERFRALMEELAKERRALACAQEEQGEGEGGD